MSNTFTPLWQCLPKVGSDLWSYKSKDPEKTRQRSALELLAGALWHLELASELGDFPKEKMSKFFEAKGGSKNPQPWEAWLEKPKGLSVEFPEDDLLLRYRFFGPLDSAVSFLIQSMLIADAALRIDGAREILSLEFPNCSRCPDRNMMRTWIGCKTFTLKGSLKEIKKHFIVVTGFRDAYMHGEIPDGESDRLRRFRVNFFNRYNLAQVAEACGEVCKELIRLARKKGT